MALGQQVFQANRTTANPIPLNNQTATEILKIILQYAATPLCGTIVLLPQEELRDWTTKYYHVYPPTVEKDSKILIRVATFFESRRTKGYYAKRIVTSKIDSSLHSEQEPHEHISSGYTMLLENTRQQDTYLGNNQCCTVALDPCPTTTQPGNLNITLYLDEACYQYAKAIAQQQKVSLEKFLGEEEPSSQASRARATDEQDVPVINAGSSSTSSSSSSLSSSTSTSSGTTESQIVHPTSPRLPTSPLLPKSLLAMNSASSDLRRRTGQAITTALNEESKEEAVIKDRVPAVAPTSDALLPKNSAMAGLQDSKRS